VPDKNAYSHVCEALQYAAIGEGEGYVVLGQSSDWDENINEAVHQ